MPRPRHALPLSKRMKMTKKAWPVLFAALLALLPGASLAAYSGTATARNRSWIFAG